MLRSLGIPARLAVGYAPGQRNPFTGLYEVRAKHAHAWAEVWFPEVGWQSFDPTASVPLAGERGVRRAGSGLVSYLSSHIPHPPAALVLAMILAVALLGAVAGGLRLRAWWSARRRARPRSWAEACLVRLERAGAEAGRPRRPSETVREYASALRHTELADPRLADVAAVVTRDAFGATPAGPAEKEAVERVLADVSGRGPR
jgi:transglutaminase-like putative cysteine protease